jgi:hypothetical protein
MAITPIDFSATALGRLVQQYRNKPKYVDLVTSLCGLAQTGIDDPLEYLITLYDIDSAQGHNLDVIGEIVGQPRIIANYDLFEFFGYEGSTASGTYGDENNPNVGARYRSSSEGLGGDRTLSDAEYRLFIRARILKNYSVSTPESIIESVKFILNAEPIKLTEGVMSLDIEIASPVDVNDLNLVATYDILPRPTGVEISSITAAPLSITISGTGDTSVDSEFPYLLIENSRPLYNLEELDGVPIGLVTTYFDGTNWVISKGSIPTPETWTNPTSTSISPPKTGWTTSDLGSPAPTISY